MDRIQPRNTEEWVQEVETAEGGRRGGATRQRTRTNTHRRKWRAGVQRVKTFRGGGGRGGRRGSRTRGGGGGGDSGGSGKGPCRAARRRQAGFGWAPHRVEREGGRRRRGGRGCALPGRASSPPGLRTPARTPPLACSLCTETVFAVHHFRVCVRSLRYPVSISICLELTVLAGLLSLCR